MYNNKDAVAKACKRSWRVRHREKENAYARKWRNKNRKKVAKYCKEYREKNKELLYIKRRQAYCKATYGITLEKKQDMILAQHSKCAICKCALTGGIQTQVDHNHATKKVRGILCTNCNSMLGFGRDNIKILQSGIQYLKKYKISIGGVE